MTIPLGDALDRYTAENPGAMGRTGAQVQNAIKTQPVVTLT